MAPRRSRTNAGSLAAATARASRERQRAAAAAAAAAGGRETEVQRLPLDSGLDPSSSPLSEPDGRSQDGRSQDAMVKEEADGMDLSADAMDPLAPPTVDYPDKYDPLSLPYPVRLLVVARHSPCLAGECQCLGYRPPNMTLTPANGCKESQVSCGCGHAMLEHGRPEMAENEELIRRSKVASRIDELLGDKGKVLDADFADRDQDTISLRKQLESPAAESDGSLKRDRDEPEHPQPPVPKALEGRVGGKGTGEHALGNRSGEVGGEAVDNGLVVGPNGPLGNEINGPVQKVKKPAFQEEEAEVIRFHVVANDGDPFSMVILTGMKNIFQKQLPKMPREYIARLVYDRNHFTMAIVKNGLQVVGGITYRPFLQRTFAEIVFCAIASNEQVRGYGSHLMNHLKDHVRQSTHGQIRHFLTYADNYAIGYFKKQGFTKDITLEKRLWVGYIKDYEGGTIMQCTMLPKIEYLRIGAILAMQKEAILTKIKEFSQSHVVHPGLTYFEKRGKEQQQHLPPPPPLQAADVPGLKESGWTPEMDAIAQRPARGPHFTTMQHLLFELQNHNAAWAFIQPVNRDEVADYYDVIKNPMDLSTMESKLEAGHYKTMDDFARDAQYIFDNCRLYNLDTTAYYKNATKLETYFKKRLAEIGNGEEAA